MTFLYLILRMIKYIKQVTKRIDYWVKIMRTKANDTFACFILKAVNDAETLT